MARPKKGYTGEDEDGSSTGRWTNEEHHLFEEGLRRFGKQWKRIAEEIPTRTVVQIRTHAQKYFLKLAKIEPATSTSIALKPPLSALTSTAQEMPLSLARKKRSIGKSTYRRRVMSVDSEEEEAEATRMAKEEAELEGEEEEEYEVLSHGEDGMSDDGSSSYPTTTTLTSRGRVSRPPRKGTPVTVTSAHGSGDAPSSSSNHTPAGGKRRTTKSNKKQKKTTAKSNNGGLPGSFGNSRVSSCSSITQGLGWAGCSSMMPMSNTTNPPPLPSFAQAFLRANGGGGNNSVVPQGVGSLMVKIPTADDDVVAGLFAGVGGVAGFSALMDAHAAGVGVGVGVNGAPGQTPTSVADLYPDGMEFSSLALGHTHAGDEDEIFAKYHPSYYTQTHTHTHAHAHGAGDAGACCASSTTSSSAGSSSAGSSSPSSGPLERATLEGEIDDEEQEGHANDGEGEGAGEEDDAFTKLQALAGRAAPDWAEALNEALGSLESHHQQSTYHHDHHQVVATGNSLLGGGAGHALRAHTHTPGSRSTGSLTDSGSHSSATTESYLPSDESDEEKQAQTHAHTHTNNHHHHQGSTRFLEEEEDECVDVPPNKRTRVNAPTDDFAIKGSSTVPFMINSSSAGEHTHTHTSAGVDQQEQEDDYGYFTTEGGVEEELDHILQNMLDNAVVPSPSSADTHVM